MRGCRQESTRRCRLRVLFVRRLCLLPLTLKRLLLFLTLSGHVSLEYIVGQNYDDKNNVEKKTKIVHWALTLR